MFLLSQRGGGGEESSGAADWLLPRASCGPFKGAERPLSGAAVGLRSPEVRRLPRSCTGAAASPGRRDRGGPVGRGVAQTAWGSVRGRERQLGPAQREGDGIGARPAGSALPPVFQEGRGLGDLFLKQADEWRLWMTSSFKVIARLGAQLMEWSNS